MTRGTFDAFTLRVAGARNRREALKLFGKGVLGIAVGGATTVTFEAAPGQATTARAASGERCIVEYPPADLDNCPNKRHHPGASPSMNGCGPADSVDLVPDTFGPVNFGPGCDIHDVCYGTCGSDRKKCDDDMRSYMYGACVKQWGDSVLTFPLVAACFKVADVYHAAVRLGGQGPWETAQKEDCECCHPVPMLYCGCNDACYEDIGTCQANCKVSLGCFTDICRPAEEGECEG